MQIDVNHDAFKNIAPLVSRLNKQTAVEEDVESVRKKTKISFNGLIIFFKMENGDENEDYDDREGNDEEDDLMDDILTSDEDEDEEKKAAVTPRRTRLVPVGAQDEGDQETLRSLSFSERTRRTADSDKSSTFTRPSVANKISTSNKEKRRKRNADDDDDHRRNVRRAPRGRMNSRRGEP